MLMTGPPSQNSLQEALQASEKCFSGKCTAMYSLFVVKELMLDFCSKHFIYFMMHNYVGREYISNNTFFTITFHRL